MHQDDDDNDDQWFPSHQPFLGELMFAFWETDQLLTPILNVRVKTTDNLWSFWYYKLLFTIGAVINIVLHSDFHM